MPLNLNFPSSLLCLVCLSNRVVVTLRIVCPVRGERYLLEVEELSYQSLLTSIRWTLILAVNVVNIANNGVLSHNSLSRIRVTFFVDFDGVVIYYLCYFICTK